MADDRQGTGMTDDPPSTGGAESPVEQTASIQLRRCPHCDQVVGLDSRFCSACGTALEVNTASLPVADVSGPIPVVDADGLSDLTPGDALLVIRRGPQEGTRFLITESPTTIGRSEDATVFLDDVTVSRKHAELRSSSKGWLLSDQGSLNGTYVNHQRIESQVLSNGDEAQIGKYRFLYHQAPHS